MVIFKLKYCPNKSCNTFTKRVTRFYLLVKFLVMSGSTSINISLCIFSRWSYHFFFYNRRLKRVVSFRFSCVRWLLNPSNIPGCEILLLTSIFRPNQLYCSNLVGEGHLLDDSSFDEDGEIFDGMDMWIQHFVHSMLLVS